MPKIPGRASTKPTYDIAKVSVASFLMPHEEWFWKRPCNAKGCDHKMGPDDQTWQGMKDWQPCGKASLPARVAFTATLKDAGLACACCVAKILEEL